MICLLYNPPVHTQAAIWCSTPSNKTLIYVHIVIQPYNSHLTIQSTPLIPQSVKSLKPYCLCPSLQASLESCHVKSFLLYMVYAQYLPYLPEYKTHLNLRDAFSDLFVVIQRRLNSKSVIRNNAFFALSNNFLLKRSYCTLRLGNDNNFTQILQI